ncbi:hypothetical protein ACWA1F_14290 [Flavobacterium sp. 3-218]
MKNQDTPQNTPQDKGNPQNQAAGPNSSNPNTNPYDSEDLDQESDSPSKDITEKDIEKDLMENDPSEGLKQILIPRREMGNKMIPLKRSIPMMAIP